MENSPPIRKEPPLKRLNMRNWKKNRPEFWRRPFFLEITWFLAEKTFEFPRNFVSNFGQTVWNWFKVNENSSQGRLHTPHCFKIAPPPPFPNPGYAPARYRFLKDGLSRCANYDSLFLTKNNNYPAIWRKRWLANDKKLFFKVTRLQKPIINQTQMHKQRLKLGLQLGIGNAEQLWF